MAANSSRSLSSSPHVSDVTGSAVLEFPSPPLSLSPFITAPPPDSPIIHLNSSAADSSTIEYASAVVSSAWGGDLSVHPDYTVGHIVSRVSASPGHELPQPTVLEYTGRTKASIMTKIKTFGKKMKKLVSVPQYNAKPERSHLPDKDPSEDVATFVQPLTLVIDTPDAPTEAGLPGEDSFVSVEQGNCLLPLPPGLTPVAVSDDITGSRPSEGNTSTLEIEARPKTLAEIKSKRSNRSVSQPNSSIIAVARTRSRPRSAIILPVASSSSIGDEDVVSVHVGRSPNAPTPAEAHERPVPVTTSTPNAHSTVRQGTDNQRNGTANKKKHRRFSLSALSHLVKST
ncbi:hypothetical protein DXG01_000172 [Tephrocybe rancida]|nr:hypothetical protein DXG01_000172 [Tephrocybe rancida]